MNFQIKLLRVLQERKLERIGSNREIDLDLWVIAATKEDLATASAEGRFREDLYYRFNVVELYLPNLCDRPEDIPQLFEYYAHKAALQYEREYTNLDEQDIALLIDYSWPGNVRQLKNMAERYVLGMGSSRTIRSLLGHGAQEENKTRRQSLSDLVQGFERQIIIQSLKRHSGNIQSVIDELEVPRRTLNNKMKAFEIKRSDYLES